MVISDLYNEEFDNISDIKLAQQIGLLKEAINDWPVDLNTVEDFVREVEGYLGCSIVTKHTIDQKLSGFSISEAWQMESLTSILELMNINQNDSFENCLRDILLLQQTFLRN
jgi:hypothetical protein